MIENLITRALEETYNIDGKWVTVRREDLAYKKPLPPNAKMSALIEIVKEKSRSYKLMAMFAKKQIGISYSIGFPYIAQEYGVKTIITYPSNEKKSPDWLLKCEKDTDVETIALHPNMVTINVNQTKKIIEERGGYFIPFGFDDAISVKAHSERFILPKNIGTLIMATMTGMTLAGAIHNLYLGNKTAKKIIGVSCGRPPENVIKSMNKYIDVPSNVEVINPYDRNFKVPNDTDCPLPLHPDYEAKAWYYMLQNIKELIEPIYFINVGA